MAAELFTDAELAALLESTTPARSDADAAFAALLGESPTPEVPEAAPPPAVEQGVGHDVLTPQPQPLVTSVGAGDGRQVAHAWENALHLLPPLFVRLVRRYPAIGVAEHPKHGLVLLAAYVEDTRRKVRRNLKLGDDLFFHAAELEALEPDTKTFDCRILVKTLRHQPGMRIRYWENTSAGDTVGKSGTFQVTERGLIRLGGVRGGGR